MATNPPPPFAVFHMSKTNFVVARLKAGQNPGEAPAYVGSIPAPRTHARNWRAGRRCKRPRHDRVFEGGPMSEKRSKSKRTPMGAARRWVDDLIADPGEGCRIDWPYHCVQTRGGPYPMIWHEGTSTTVSRLVCEAFHGPPAPGEVARHGSCHDSMCLQPIHLSWGSQIDNTIDTIRDGTWRGVVMGSAILSEKQVLEIVVAIDSGERIRQIADRYNVSDSTIYDIRKGKRWNWLTRRVPVDPKAFRQAFAEVTEDAADRVQQGLSVVQPFETSCRSESVAERVCRALTAADQAAKS